MRNRTLAVVLALFGILGLAACTNADTNPTDPANPDDGEVRSTGISLTSDTLGDTDVARMQFQVTGVNCNTGNETGFQETQTRDLADMMLPGGIERFQNTPVGGDGQHLFADAFFLIDAGCYDVQTTPLADNGQPSQDCESAHRDRVAVEDGQTTEILLVNQCQGAERGGLDTVSSLNHAPELENLEYQKFVSSCPAELQVCATASDADGDDLEFAWSEVGDDEDDDADITVASTNQLDNGNFESCADISVNQQGTFQFRVDVFDLDADGNRMQDILTQQEGEQVQSNTGVQFPVHSGVTCEQEPEAEVQGRNVTILMALTGAEEGADFPWLIENAVRWVSPSDNPAESRIAVVSDDNTQGEFMPEDLNFLVEELRASGQRRTAFDVTVIEEPEDGINFDAIDEFDVVWFQNPGQPMDDPSSFDAITQFQQEGGGLILQGDDMAHSEFDADRSMQSLTHLEYLNNGDTVCGDQIAPGSGNFYSVSYTDEPLQVIDELRGRTFRYGSDIDNVRPTLTGEQILADASYASGNCSYQGPAISAFDPGQEGAED